MTDSVLVVDDDPLLAKNIRTYLGRYGYSARSVANGRDALQQVENWHPDVVLLDLNLPDISGLELLAQILRLEPQTQIIMMTGAGSVQVAVDAMKAGAHDYLSKPLVLSEIRLLLDRLQQSRSQANALSYYQGREASQSGLARIVGDSTAMQSVKSRITQFIEAESRLQGQPPPTVLVSGETGTGKELVARAFHFEGARSGQPFVELNCASIPSQLLESELFGHERGAFTDAHQRKIGLVDAANGGTLFLDEIGEMDIALQAKLLTLIENRRVRRLGSVHEHEVNVRIIAATNRDLESRVADGHFRSDLYYRLRVVHLLLPPLRERRGDIPQLAAVFLQQLGARYQKPALELTAAAAALLEAHHWPGNVRELKNTLEQAVILCQDSAIEPHHLPFAATVDAAVTTDAPADDGLSLRHAEVRLIEEALAKTSGNVSRAAALLGISRDTLRYRLDKYGLRNSD